MPSLSELFNSVKKVISEKSFLENSKSFDRRPLIERTNALGGQRMKLLHWEVLKECEEIPRSTDEKTVDAIEGIETYDVSKVEVIMVSHQWLRPSLNKDEAHPDSAEHLKASSLNQYSNWRRSWVMQNHDFYPEIFYWIDYSCLDQNNPNAGVPLLPLWVASCERFLKIDTPNYNQRAWCRLEPLLSHVFSFADHLNTIDLNFKCNWPNTGAKKFQTLLDPVKGLTTDPNDMPLIKELVDLTKDASAASGYFKMINFNSTKLKTFHL